jgi:hypothetical protein
VCFVALGCGDDATALPDAAVEMDAGAMTSDAGGTIDAGSGTSDAGAPACAPTPPDCIDEQIGALDLFATPSDGAITEEGTTAAEFLTHIDATGGGLMPSESFVYARFTDAGLTKVDVGDEAAFESTEWDIALRRYVVRVNSGVSGPSCVGVGRTAPGTTFESVTALPEGLEFRTEAYVTDTCELVPDGSGLGAPGTALASFWTYEMCVEMTGNVYVVRLASGRHVKLEVIAYYELPQQTTCNETHSVPMPSGAGNVRIRWAFLP